MVDDITLQGAGNGKDIVTCSYFAVFAVSKELVVENAFPSHECGKVEFIGVAE